MARITINYRRDDTSPWAGRLYDRLVAEFGREQVFMDIDTLEPGVDFVEEINRVVAESHVLVTMIGPAWTSITDPQGKRRLDNPMDFVRLEVAAALKRNIRVVPVLVGGAVMPTADNLPEDLVALARRHAIEISDSRFHADVDRLIASIKQLLDRLDREARAAVEPPRGVEPPKGMAQSDLADGAPRLVEEPWLASPPEPKREAAAPVPKAAGQPSVPAADVSPARSSPPSPEPRAKPLAASAERRSQPVKSPAPADSLLRGLLGLGEAGAINWTQCLIVVAALWVSYNLRTIIELGTPLTSLVRAAALVFSGVLCLSLIKSEARAIVAAGVLHAGIATMLTYATMPDYYASIPFFIRTFVSAALWPMLLFAALSIGAPKFRSRWLGIFVVVTIASLLHTAGGFLIFERFLVRAFVFDLGRSAILGTGLWLGYRYAARR